MGEMVHRESFLPSARDLSEDSNSCSKSMHCGDKNQNGFSMRAPPPRESYSGYERDFLKQTMLQHEAVFKNQVHELHRLYRTQKSLMDEVKGNNSERTPESAIKRDLPAFLLGQSLCGEGSSKVPTQNGIISSKDEEVVRPVKVRRRMIDLQLPADEYLDDADGGENTSSPQEAGERGNASSHLNDSSLVMKKPNGLTDLNEPVQCQESSVHGSPSSRDIYSLYGKNIAHAQRQWLETTTNQNGWMLLEAGNGKSIPRENLCMPSPGVQVLANNAFQPLGYPSNRQRNPEVSYESYVESSVASNAPPSLTNGYRPESGRTWSHWIPSRENTSSSSVQTSLPFQTNPFLSFNAQARADSSSEMRSLYHGFSSGSKETAFNIPPSNLNHLNNGPRGGVTNASLKHQSFESLQGPKRQESSAVFPWLKPKPLNKNGLTNGGFDLNASAGSDAPHLSPHNGLRSFSCSNDANLGRAEMASSLSNGKTLGYSISHKPSIWECNSSLNPSSLCPKEANTLVNRNFDINLPCDASVSEALVVDKEESTKAGTKRNFIDLNLCASEDEDAGLCSKPKANTLIDLEAPPALESEEEEGEKMLEKRDEAGETFDELIKGAAEAIVTISLSHITDEAASSTTDPVAKDPLSWFVNTIASCGNDLEKKIDACEGCREECSSGEVDYFETMTLNFPLTKEEDYMPTPLVPEHLKFEGTDSMANRPRRGQARRGRPRRDFQRDVLPGLASLSRVEVTEDVQMFEGLMKATGYSNWNSGVARRSSNRGRKRLVSSNVNGAPVEQTIDNSNVQMVGLEERSLTGWGNATRRPRRQRCPAGSTPPTVVLT